MPDRKLCLNGCFKTKPIGEFYRHSASPDGYMPRCKACQNERAQVARHGLSKADKDAIAQRQGGCAICRRPAPGAMGWVVDHDRTCCPNSKSCIKCRRGVLCTWCNSALGYALDSPETLRRMADYLESGNRLTELNSQLTQLIESHGRTD